MRLTVPVRSVFWLEILSLVRDPRTLLISVVLPIILIPAILVAGNWAEEREARATEALTFRLAVEGERSDLARSLLGVRDGDRMERLDPRFALVSVEDPWEALASERIDVVLEAMDVDSWNRGVQDGSIQEGPTPPPSELEAVPRLRLHFHSNRTTSREGAQALRTHLLETREARRDSILLAAGFPVPPGEVLVVESVNVATSEAMEGALLGRFLTLILLGLMALGGSALATDTLAGEKERGTLNTLLTAAARRQEIISGKLLAIMAVAFGIALVQVLNIWFFLGLGIVEVGGAFAVRVPPEIALLLLVVYLPAIALVSGVLLLTSAYARSYKEAQLYLTPVLLGLIIPSAVPLLPGISLQSAIILIPIANLGVAVRDMMMGDLQPAWVMSAWIITALAAAWVIRRSVLALDDERLILGERSVEEHTGGEGLFRKRVVIWILVLWAVKILVSFNLPFTDIRVVSLISIGLLFTLFPTAAILRYRLPVREALALRMPHPGVWIGVLIGVPAGILTVMGVFQLVDTVVPVPTEMLESLGQALMPDGIPLWQLLVVVALVPGIAEELTFRGVILHGLRRRLGPVALALVVGLIFGLFHFSIFRIPTTAALGVMLTAVTLLTGSIFPAMVWHILNNAVAVLVGRDALPGIDPQWFSEGVGWGWSLGGVALLLVAFGIIWRFRTPYPDMGPPAPPEVPAGRAAPRAGSVAST